MMLLCEMVCSLVLGHAIDITKAVKLESYLESYTLFCYNCKKIFSVYLCHLLLTLFLS